MKFGVREICDVVFKAKSDTFVGNKKFRKGEPVLLIDTATTSTIEGAATTVYAQGGRGNVRLLAWEGEKTLTFTVEDALLSPIGFAVLSGAGLLKPAKANTQKIHVHTTSNAVISDGAIELPTKALCAEAPIFVVKTEADGSLSGDMLTGLTVVEPTGDEFYKLTVADADKEALEGKSVFVDYYVKKDAYNVTELQIDAKNFAGYYYVEASTLFKRQDTGEDMPAEITFPKVKIQSNFTFTMAATGDPSTFTFTMDAFPDYTYFDKTRQVLCVIQVIDETEDELLDYHTVMEHDYYAEALESNPDSENYLHKNDEKTLVGEDGYTDSTHNGEEPVKEDADVAGISIKFGNNDATTLGAIRTSGYTIPGAAAATDITVAVGTSTGVASVTVDPTSISADGTITVTPVASEGYKIKTEDQSIEISVSFAS